MSNKIIALATFAAAVSSAQALASAYPADYCHQNVRVLDQNPALFAHVGSGCDSFDVIGYKKTGSLAAGNPEYLDATITATCTRGADSLSKTTTVRLGREWNGAGYLSESHDSFSSIPQGCDPYEGEGQVRFNVSFATPDGRVDAGAYGYAGYAFYKDAANASRVVTTKTGTVGNGNVSPASWSFIIGKMAN